MSQESVVFTAMASIGQLLSGVAALALLLRRTPSQAVQDKHTPVNPIETKSTRRRSAQEGLALCIVVMLSSILFLLVEGSQEESATRGFIIGAMLSSCGLVVSASLAGEFLWKIKNSK